MEDLLWLPIINHDKNIAEPKGFPRILFYGQIEKNVFETKKECQTFCDNSKVVKEKPYEDCEEGIFQYVIKPKE